MNAMEKRTMTRRAAASAAAVLCVCLLSVGLRPQLRRLGWPGARPGPKAQGPELGSPQQGVNPRKGPAPNAAPAGAGGADAEALMSASPGSPETRELELRDALASMDAARVLARASCGMSQPAGWWIGRPKAGGSPGVERHAADWLVKVLGPAKVGRTPLARSRGPAASLPALEGALPRTRVGSGLLTHADAASGRAGASGASRSQSRHAVGRLSESPNPAARGHGSPGLGSRRKPRPAASLRPRAVAKARADLELRLRVFRPILLSKLLGKNAIRPPKGRIDAPDLRYLGERLPRTLPDGAPLAVQDPGPEEVEAGRPPDPKALSAGAPCPKKAHWHREGSVLHHHADEAWGRWQEGHWSWHARKGGRWWVSAGPQIPTLLWHGKHWWWKASGLWFLLHQGEPWGYRQLTDLGLDALVHPSSGTTMVYSKDGTRVALITPGQGAVLFDAVSGAVLGRWTEDEMPKPRRPKAPTSLTF
ncbi:MAG: hypothetical protein HY748_10725 [Elusimicrobia bacterium]|nr:hypothetical protein [Elusimicrobiota bacterium]